MYDTYVYALAKTTHACTTYIQCTSYGHDHAQPSKKRVCGRQKIIIAVYITAI